MCGISRTNVLEYATKMVVKENPIVLAGLARAAPCLFCRWSRHGQPLKLLLLMKKEYRYSADPTPWCLALSYSHTLT